MAIPLLIRLINQIDGVSFECYASGYQPIFISHEQLAAAEFSSPDLSSLLDQASKIIILVPGQAVVTTTVRLPKLSMSKLVKALPYALEEQLTGSPESLHMAIGGRFGEDELSVAILSKNIMRDWVSQLRSVLHGNMDKVTAILPDYLALPYHENGITILFDEGRALVRLSLQAGFSIECEALNDVLTLLNASGKHTMSMIHGYGISPDMPKINSSIPIQWHQIDVPVIQFVSDHLQENHVLNLLQGEYAITHRDVRVERILYVFTALMAGWLLLLTLGDGLRFYTIHRENKILSNNIETLYHSIFPNVSVPSDPKRILQKELTKLRSSTQDSAFIRMANSLGEVVRPLLGQGLTLERVRYTQNQLIMEITAENPALFNQLKVVVEGAGFKVVMGGAERSSEGMVKTRLTIEEVT